jgi:hypothetical protein
VQTYIVFGSNFGANAHPAYVIKDPASIGDLHGGIEGTHYSGIIGDAYKKYPFPNDQMKFKQQTEGFNTREEFEQMILRALSD